MSFVCNLDLNGIIVPIVTPVDENESIDENLLRKQVDHVIEGGVNGILAYGSNGEFYMLSEEEMERGIKIIVDQTKKRVPVYFGIGAISTKQCIKLAKMAQENGVDGISVIQPMFIRPNEVELFNHFKAIADSVPNLPMLLYNNPGKIGYPMSPNFVEKIVKECENIIGMKDSSGDITVLQEFIRVTKGRPFSVLGGKDTLIYATLAVGGCGAVCSTANMFPELVCGIYNKYASGDLYGSLEDQYKLNPVRLSMDKATFPVSTKDMSTLMGLEVGNPILPTLPSNEDTINLFKTEMKKAGLL